MADTEIYCHWELASFPASDFEHRPDFGLVHIHPPNGAPEHTASGEPLPAEGAPNYWGVPSSVSAGDNADGDF
jgi:hypothetical protein